MPGLSDSLQGPDVQLRSQGVSRSAVAEGEAAVPLNFRSTWNADDGHFLCQRVYQNIPMKHPLYHYIPLYHYCC
jgi:hypothetical protein